MPRQNRLGMPNGRNPNHLAGSLLIFSIRSAMLHERNRNRDGVAEPGVIVGHAASPGNFEVRNAVGALHTQSAAIASSEQL